MSDAFEKLCDHSREIALEFNRVATGLGRSL